MNQPPILSDLIVRITVVATEAGNAVKVISDEWKPKQVVFMERPLSAATKSQITEQLPEAESFSSAATPHNPATEGFIDRGADVVIVFPADGGPRRWY